MANSGAIQEAKREDLARVKMHAHLQVAMENLLAAAVIAERNGLAGIQLPAPNNKP